MSPTTTVSKKLQLKDLIDYRLKVLTTNGSVYVGILKGFDKFMNMTLLDCYELRINKKSLEKLKSITQNTEETQSEHVHKEKRILGFIILRGENVLSTSIESPPLLDKKQRKQEQQKLDKKFKKFGKKKNTDSQAGGRASSLSKKQNSKSVNAKKRPLDDNNTDRQSSKKQKKLNNAKSKQLPPGFKKT
ncbi:hypothetical protein ACO0QE_004588 [Hanseniaspora vineae]